MQQKTNLVKEIKKQVKRNNLNSIGCYNYSVVNISISSY